MPILDFYSGDHSLVKVMKANHDIAWGSDDHLANAGDAYLLSEDNSFAVGAVSGNPQFVSSELDMDDAGWLVDMTWQCAPPGDGLEQPPGYVVHSGDIGCDAIPQKFVLRVLDSGARVKAEIYGDASLGISSKTWAIPGGGRGFALHHGAFELEGELVSWGTSSATVALSSIQYDSEDVCETGTYVFPAE